MKTVLFYQHFGKKGVVRGAHHKTFDFFNHIKSMTGYQPVIYFEEDSIWDDNLPWYDCFEKMPTLKDQKVEPDILFLNSGKDWIRYTQHRKIPQGMPVISPVNNFRALNPEHKSFEFLTEKAIRLCPSPELYNAVKTHHLTNGHTVYLPNGVGINDEANTVKYKKTIDLLIVGNKNPEMAQQLSEKVQSLEQNIVVIDEWISKKDFQLLLAKSKVSVHLPKVVEEHYIPGVEAMMLDSLLIIPDCVGNRSYSQHLKTCVLCDYSLEGMTEAIQLIQNMPKNDQEQLKANAKEESKKFTIQNEKNVLEELLNMTNVNW